MKMEQSFPKRRHINFRRRGITQKKTYNKDNFISMFDECRIRTNRFRGAIERLRVPDEWTTPRPVLYLVRYSYRSVLKIKRYVSGTDSVPVPGINIRLMTELIGPI